MFAFRNGCRKARHTDAENIEITRGYFLWTRFGYSGALWNEARKVNFKIYFAGDGFGLVSAHENPVQK